MHRHVPPLAGILLVRHKLIHKIRQREPALPKHALLAVLAEDDVLLLQGRSRPDRHRLLARRYHIKAETTLALRVKHDEVHDGDGEHIAVQLHDGLVGQVGLEVGVDGLAVLVDGAVRREGRERRRLLEAHRVAERRLDGARERHMLRVWSLRERACVSLGLERARLDRQDEERRLVGDATGRGQGGQPREAGPLHRGIGRVASRGARWRSTWKINAGEIFKMLCRMP